MQKHSTLEVPFAVVAAAARTMNIHHMAAVVVVEGVVADSQTKSNLATEELAVEA